MPCRVLPDAARLNPVLGGDEVPDACLHESPQELLIERLDGAHVDDKGAGAFRRGEGKGKERAEGKDGGIGACPSRERDFPASEADLILQAVLKDRNCGRRVSTESFREITELRHCRVRGNAQCFPGLRKRRGLRAGLIPRALRIAHGDRAPPGERRVKHRAEVADEPRRHDHHVRNGEQERNVKHALMRGTVGPHDAGVVNGDYDREVGERHVMHDLVVGPLQEGGVDAHNGPHAARR